jgi:hypothetical protein
MASDPSAGAPPPLPPWADQAVQAGLIHEHLTVTAPLVAQAFARECGVPLQPSAGPADRDAATATRVAVRDALLRDRDAAAAAAAISAAHPSLLAGDARLRFRLAQQGVVDRLTRGRWQDALAAASAQLVGTDEGRSGTGGGGGDEDGLPPPPPPPPWPPQYAADVDTTMALFLFDAVDDDTVAAGAAPAAAAGTADLPAPLAALISDAHRTATADAVNVALLAAAGESTHARLPALLQQLLPPPSLATPAAEKGAGRRSTGAGAAGAAAAGTSMFDDLAC